MFDLEVLAEVLVVLGCRTQGAGQPCDLGKVNHK